MNASPGASSPLLEEIVELEAGAKALATLAPLRSESTRPGIQCLELEQLLRLVAVLVPGKRLVALQHATRSLAEGAPTHERWASAVRDDDESVRCALYVGPRAANTPVAFEARVRFADAPPAQPALPLLDRRLLERVRGRDAAALYEAKDANDDFFNARNILWAARISSGHLMGAVRARGGGECADGGRTLLPDAALEGVLQLSRWLWYAFGGERSHVTGFASARWYRLPRFDETLLAQVRLRGATSGQPVMDAQVVGDVRDVLLEVSGLRLSPLRAVRPPNAPVRPAWLRFVRDLEPRSFAGADR
ncbi:MAG: hypothetical protein ACT4TC_17215 [Myxococcaceae bacterium]